MNQKSNAPLQERQQNIQHSQTLKVMVLCLVTSFLGTDIQFPVSQNRTKTATDYELLLMRMLPWRTSDFPDR